MSLLKLEREYCTGLDNQYMKLVGLYNEIKSNVSPSLEGREITKAILLRMKIYYETQNKIKAFLNKRYLPAASDFFVESIVFYLKLIFDIGNTGLEVHSERQIRPERGAIRPDISVWKDNEVLAIIECKTQLGWNRKEWERDFKQREGKLKQHFPKANAFLVVMTSENWGGFPDKSKGGKQYFTLSSTWPANISMKNIETMIVNPIEILFSKIIEVEGKWKKR